jgi:hypothetical protein
MRRTWLAALFVLVFAACGSAADAARIAWQGGIEIASGRGEKGPWQQNESRYDYVDDPSVAINHRGEIAMVWVDQRRKGVFFQPFEVTASGELKRLRQPINVSRTPQTFSWLPRIAHSPQDPHRLYVLWQEIIFSGGSHGGDILFAASGDAGASFSQPLNLSESVGGAGKGRINKDIWHNGSLDLAIGADNVIHAVWTEYEGGLWFAQSPDGGNTFSTPRQLAGGANEPARGPALALGAGSTVHVAWTVGEDDAADIRVMTSEDGGGNFAQPVVAAPSANYSDAPKLAVDSRGILHLVYAESAGGAFDRYHIRYTRSTDGGRSFEAPREISAPPSAPAASSAFPHLALDGSDRLYVLWELFPHPRARPRGLGFAFSPDGGETFGRPEMVPDSADPGGAANGSNQGLLMKKLAASRAGHLAIVNSSLKQNERSRVWLIRGKIIERERD